MVRTTKPVVTNTTTATAAAMQQENTECASTASGAAENQTTTTNNSELPSQMLGSLFSEKELVLLCLDYLRDLRRVYPPQVLRSVEGIDADYLTIACWALNRVFLQPPYLQQDNDAYFDRHKAGVVVPYKHTPGSGKFPSLASMEKEILYLENPHKSDEDGEQKKEEDDAYSTAAWYEYDDSHPSNVYRFYPLGGLLSGPSLRSSLSLAEIAAAGLAGLGARSRLEAEKDMIQSPLFEQFFLAVQAKGFFDEALPQDNSNGGSSSGGHSDDDDRRQHIYEDRYRKVVAKFRTKLSSKAEGETVGELVSQAAAEQQRQRRALKIHQAMNENSTAASSIGSDVNGIPSAPRTLLTKQMFVDNTDKESAVSSSGAVAHNPIDLEEAENLKSLGNSHMQNKEYQEAADCYTQALKLSPAGPHSHVYFSNRAAALVSMKRFHEAILDSERSLALQPEYGKAHARLGLAHFLLGNYRQAMEAYAVALKYEPDNKSSKSYLEKAAKRLAASGEVHHQGAIQTSFSVVSEWEKSSTHRHREVNDERQAMLDEREAEKYKVKGNSAMASREYKQALDAYTRAIQLCPNGYNSHVYYSNRAAALCYLERYSEAEKDSLKALSLNPKYGKANARLGLSRFFLQDYRGAIAAYTEALELDPDNAASKSYLAKAQAKLEALADSRRMMDSPEFRRSAEKALQAEKADGRA